MGKMELRAEIKRLQAENERLQAEATPMRKALSECVTILTRLRDWYSDPAKKEITARMNEVYIDSWGAIEDAERTLESTTAGASLLDRKKYEAAFDRLQAEAAAITDLAQRMADFLWGISRGMPFGRDVAQQLNQEYCSRKTTAGQSILDRMKKAEAVVTALQRLKAAEMRIGAASLSGLQEIKAASQERYDAEKALDAALAEYEGAK